MQTCPPQASRAHPPDQAKRYPARASLQEATPKEPERTSKMDPKLQKMTLKVPLNVNSLGTVELDLELLTKLNAKIQIPLELILYGLK